MLHPKGALPTNMGFHHSIFTVRILTVPFLEAPPVGPPKTLGLVATGGEKQPTFRTAHGAPALAVGYVTWEYGTWGL